MRNSVCATSWWVNSPRATLQTEPPFPDSAGIQSRSRNACGTTARRTITASIHCWPSSATGGPSSGKSRKRPISHHGACGYRRSWRPSSRFPRSGISCDGLALDLCLPSRLRSSWFCIHGMCATRRRHAAMVCCCCSGRWRCSACWKFSRPGAGAGGWPSRLPKLCSHGHGSITSTGSLPSMSPSQPRHGKPAVRNASAS